MQCATIKSSCLSAQFIKRICSIEVVDLREYIGQWFKSHTYNNPTFEIFAQLSSHSSENYTKSLGSRHSITGRLLSSQSHVNLNNFLCSREEVASEEIL